MIPKGPGMHKFKSIYFQIQRQKGKELVECYFSLAYRHTVIKDDFLVIRGARTQN